MTLTVTDDLGDIGTTTNAVTLAGPIAVDSFTRTSASGWGSANAAVRGRAHRRHLELS